MENKVSICKIIFIIVIMSNLVSCQEKVNNKNIYEKGFVVQDTLLYYNQKPLAFGDHVDKFIAALGKYDREVIDSSGGKTNKSWDWKKSGYEAYVNDNNKIKVFNSKINELNAGGEYNTIEEVIKKYGKFDSFKEDKHPLIIRKTLVWDNLGVKINIDQETNLVEGLGIQIMHITKTRDFDMTDMENDVPIFKRQPKQEYTGSFTYNGNTINFKELGHNSWDKAIAGLKIGGEDFDPPGDSKSWSREIRESYKSMMVFIERFSNQHDGAEIKPKVLLDGIKDISITRFSNDDKK